MSDIDDLSRELTEEIEAHRVTRARAEKAEASKAELIAELQIYAEDCWSPRLKAILAKHEGE